MQQTGGIKIRKPEEWFKWTELALVQGAMGVSSGRKAGGTLKLCSRETGFSQGEGWPLPSGVWEVIHVIPDTSVFV